MMLKGLRAIPLLALSLLLTSCGPSYPKDQIVEGFIRLCKAEYGLDVRAKLVDGTLGAMVEIPGLIDELRKQSASSTAPMPVIAVEGEYQMQGFDFSFTAEGSFARTDPKKRLDSGCDPNKEETEPEKKLRHVAMSIHRVSVSTDADIQFYKLICRDPGPDMLDLILFGHTRDSKRFQYMAIARGDLQYRSGFAVRPQPEALARLTVEGFLRDLGTVALPQLLTGYVAHVDRLGALFPKILSVSAKIKGRHEKLLQAEWSILQIEADKLLVYVPLYPLGDSGALLFTVMVSENRGGLYDIDQLDTSILPAQYRDLGSIQEWGNQFYLEPVDINVFLADQIAKRVLSEFEAMPATGEEAAAKGYLPQEATPDDVAKVVVETAAFVVHAYEFTDFEEITVTDAVRGDHWIVPAGDLDLYRTEQAPELQPAL